MKFSFRRSLALTAVVCAGLAALPADAKTFRWANSGDVSSMDPYARQETFLLTFTSNIYEPLVRRDKDLKLEPALATKWGQLDKTTWFFDLRQGVKFSDGTPFTADDAVFSLNRANGPGSNMGSNFASVKEIKKINDYRIEVITKYPDPLLADKWAALSMMSKAWAEKNNAVNAAEMTKNEENYATRNAMGTGAFLLKERRAGEKTVLVPNPNWWDKPTHNLTEVIFTPVANPATRVAALKAGDIDMMYEVPPADTETLKKDANIKVLEGPETRVVYLGMDQERNELLESNVKGKKPDEAKKLLADAGYPNGFEVGMDCPNDRYVNDEKICQAVVAMLAKIGVKVSLRAQTRNLYFAKILSKSDLSAGETSFYMLGWSPAQTYDVHNVFEALIESPNKDTKKGQFNAGGYSNPKLDKLADAMEQETDKAKRDAEIAEATKLYVDDFAYIPLHQQAVVWAARKNIDLVQPADNSFPLRFVTVK